MNGGLVDHGARSRGQKQNVCGSLATENVQCGFGCQRLNKLNVAFA